MKRIFFGVFLSLIFSIALVSAYGFLSSPRYLSEKIIDDWTQFLEPILNSLLGGQDWSGFLIFERLLLAIIMLSVVFLALGVTPVFNGQKDGLKWLISICVTLIGIRFVGYDWLYTITVQYGVLTIALTAILPFVIYFFFVHNVAADHPALRKIAWIFFIVVYFGVWSTVESEGASDIYFWTILASLVFLFFDGTIHRYYLDQQMKAAGSTNIWQHIARLKNDMEEIRRAGFSPAVEDRLLREKERQIKRYERYLK